MLTLEILTIPQPVARDRAERRIRIQALLRFTPVRASGTAIPGTAIPAYPGSRLRDRYSRFPSPGRLFIGLHWQLSDHQIPSVFLSRNMARAVASKAELALY